MNRLRVLWNVLLGRPTLYRVTGRFVLSHKNENLLMEDCRVE